MQKRHYANAVTGCPIRNTTIPKPWCAVDAKPMPSAAADYGTPYYFDLNWMSIRLTQRLLAKVRKQGLRCWISA